MIFVQTKVEKVVVWARQVATEAPFLFQSVPDGSAPVRQHPGECRGRPAITHHSSQEADVLPDRSERTRRVKEHEPIGHLNPELLESFNSLEVLLDRHFFIEYFEPFFGAGFYPHVNQKEPCVAQLGKQVVLHIFSTATDFPDHAVHQSSVVHAANQLVGPASAGAAPQGEVVILEKNDADTVMAMQVTHLLDHLCRLADANHLARGCAIERVNGTEGTTARAASARKQGERRKPANLLRIEGPVGERQGVEILHLSLIHISEPTRRTP